MSIPVEGTDRALTDILDLQEEVLATGDGSTLTFSGTLAKQNILRGSVEITVGTTTISDNRYGVLYGLNAIGTIDYFNGTWSLTFAVAPTNGTTLDIDYKGGSDWTKYIPPGQASKDLFVKIDAVLEEAMRLASQEEWNDILYKERDIQLLSEEALLSYVREKGFGYITDTFSLSHADLKIFASYLGLIQHLKNTRKGVELVLRLLRIEDYELEEWWETTPEGTPQTYSLKAFIDITLDGYTESSLLGDRLEAFLVEYVFPKGTITAEPAVRIVSEVPKVAAVFSYGIDIQIDHD